jgi:hypothetical protein
MDTEQRIGELRDDERNGIETHEQSECNPNAAGHPTSLHQGSS